MSEIQEFSLSEAAKYLKANLSDTRTQKSWEKYLNENPVNYLKQHGFRISYIVINGELHYTEKALNVFIKLMGSSVARKEINIALRDVDRKEMKKRKKFPKTPNWQFKKKQAP